MMGGAALIDLDHLNMYIADDTALRDEILAIFEEQAEKWADLFDPEQPDETWRNSAHGLKGASRGIGAWDVGNLCERAEKMIGEAPEKFEERAALLVELRQKLGETVAEARRLRDALS
ncbi:MAG: Hpt domain-containing protein [Pseudomonadota bacterium]